MAPTDPTPEQGLDLDEDLFDFEELRAEEALSDDDDLDAIFASFDDVEIDVAAEPFAPPEPAPVPRSAAPAPTAPQPEPVAQAGTQPVDRPAPTPALQAPPPSAAPAPTLVPPYDPRIAAAAPPQYVQVPQYAAVAPAPAADGVTRLRLSPSVLLIFAALTAMNGLVALVAIKSSSSVRDSIEQVGDELGSLTSETIDLARDAEATLRQSRDPFGVDIEPEDHPTLDEVEADIRRGDFVRARRRLYSLLAILDRIEPARRAEVERRATFLLGTARHLEALERAREEGS